MLRETRILFRCLKCRLDWPQSCSVAKLILTLFSLCLYFPIAGSICVWSTPSLGFEAVLCLSPLSTRITVMHLVKTPLDRSKHWCQVYEDR